MWGFWGVGRRCYGEKQILLNPFNNVYKNTFV